MVNNYIKEAFEKAFPIEISTQLAVAITRFVMEYEMHDTNMQAFSSPFLGLWKCYFKDSDRSGFFDLFSLETDTLNRLIETRSGEVSVFGIDVKDILKDSRRDSVTYSKEAAFSGISTATIKKTISTIPSINTEFKVISDPFNLFCVYVVYRIGISKLPQVVKYNAQFAVLKLLQYKFFTSIVSFRYRFRPQEAAMHATYEQLTERFDVKKYGSWKAVIEKRVQEMLDDTSIHKQALTTFTDDKAVLYFISDFETRIRNQINVFTAEFMRVKDSRDLIGSYSSIATDGEGDKVLLAQEDKLESAILQLYNTALVTARFLDDQAIRIVASQFTAISNQQFRRVLISFSEYAVRKYKEGKKDETKPQGEFTLLLGPAVFIRQAVQQSFRYCTNSGVNINNPLQVLKTVKGVFSSSRISDSSILSVKMTVDVLVNEIQESRRETTVSALRIALVMYLVLLAFKIMK